MVNAERTGLQFALTATVSVGWQSTTLEHEKVTEKWKTTEGLERYDVDFPSREESAIRTYKSLVLQAENAASGGRHCPPRRVREGRPSAGFQGDSGCIAKFQVTATKPH